MLLEEIYRGNFTPSDFAAPSDPEYKAINQKILELTDQLRAHLSPDDYQLLDELGVKICTAICIELKQCFVFSFSGVRDQKIQLAGSSGRQHRVLVLH